MRLGKAFNPSNIMSKPGEFFRGKPSESTSQSTTTAAWRNFPGVAKSASDIATGADTSYQQALANAITGGRESLDLARDLAFGGAGKAQYSQAASRWRNEFMPGLTARGLATSGPGIDIEAQKLQEMAIDQQAKSVQLLQDASKGLALLEAMPMELRSKIMAMIFGAGSEQQASARSVGEQPSLFNTLSAGIKDLGAGMKDMSSGGGGIMSLIGG